MSSQKSYKRCRSKVCRVRYMTCIFFMLLAFLSSATTFIFTFYTASDFIFELIAPIFLLETTRLRFHLSARDAIKFYQPREFPGKKKSVQYDYYITYNDFDFRKPQTLTYKTRIYSNNTEILFRFPRKTPISALLFIFHGCRRTANEWFSTSERQRIIGAAIDLGYACLVFQATDNTTKCWSNDADIYQNKDIQMVLKGLEGFYKEYPELVLLPRFTFGSSSGGIFSSIFAINQHYRIQGQIIFTSIILPEILYTHVKAQNYPATAWIHMLRDVEFASEERINVTKQILIEQNIPCIALPIEPLQVTPTTFHERLPSINYETSRYLFYQFQRNRWLNYNNYLIYNPRHKLSWQTFLFPLINDNIAAHEIFRNLIENKYIIYDFIHTIYGEHEISYERSSEALRWLKHLDLSSKKFN